LTEDNKSAKDSSNSSKLFGQPEENILTTSFSTRRRALTQTIGNARGLDINSPMSVETSYVDISNATILTALGGSTTTSPPIMVVIYDNNSTTSSSTTPRRPRHADKS
jgi:hypothetical protein